MSQPDLRVSGVLVQKPKTNVYTVMLVLSLVAIIIGCIFLYAEINRYRQDPNAAPPEGAPAASMRTPYDRALHGAEFARFQPIPATTELLYVQLPTV